MKRVLIFGGTGDAAQLAAQVAALPEVEVISSLAGRIRQPAAPSGRMRIGGFGGVAGLIDYVREQHIDLLIDATHPFATHMSFHATAAAQACGLPHLMLTRQRGHRCKVTAGFPSKASPLLPLSYRMSPSGCFSPLADKNWRRLRTSQTCGF